MSFQIVKFIVIGVIAVLIDFILYALIYEEMNFSVSLSKAAGFLAGAIFSYFANKIWTFDAKQHSLAQSFKRHMLLYLFTLIINILSNYFSLLLFNTITQEMKNLNLIASFMIATSLSSALNFFGMKYWVFSESGDIK